MFNILCHKFIFVFENVTVGIDDLIDIVADTKVPPTKKQLIAKLTRIIDKRKQDRDRLSKETNEVKTKKLRTTGEGGPKTVKGTGKKS